MNNIAIKYAALTAMSAAALPLAADTEAKGKASVTLVSTLDIEPGQELYFGKILLDDKGGTIKVGVDGRPDFGGLKATDDSPETTAGTFTIKGRRETKFHVEIPRPKFPLRLEGGIATIDAQITSIKLQTHEEEQIANGDQSFTSESTRGHGPITLDKGTMELAVGASLEIRRDTPAGEYKGTYDVNLIRL